MTEHNLGSNFSWWIGEVVDVKDPDQSGRYRVRIYGKHDDKTNIKDKDLPWALPLQPVTSAAIGKVGTTPSLLKGSRVMGFWADKDEQYPIILGSFGKAGDVKNNNTTAGGTEEIDINTGSAPTASTTQSDPVDINPFSKMFKGRVTVDEINDGLKTIDKLTRDTGVVNKQEVDKKLKTPKAPTTASQGKNEKSDVLDIIKSSDPENRSASLKNMVDNYRNVSNMMNVTSPRGQVGMLTSGISGALGILSGNLNFNNILPVLKLTAASGLLPPTASSALYNAMSVASIANASGKLSSINPISNVIPQINPRNPRPSIIVDVIPPTYVQQYYPLDREPYPGYIEWRDPVTRNTVYSLRGNEPHYPTAKDYIAARSASQLVSTMGKLLSGGTPSTPEMAGAIIEGLNLVQSLGISSVLGNGVNLGSMISLASHFLPGLSGLVGKNMSSLPSSFLDSGKVTSALSNFTKNQSMLALKKQSMKSALDVDYENNFAQTESILSGLDQLGAEKLKNLPAGSSITLSTEMPDGTLFAKTFSK